MYNISVKETNFSEKQPFNELFEKSAISMLQLFITYWQNICFMFFVFYYAQNPALFAMVLPLIVFGYFMIQEGLANILIWKLSYIYISIVIIVKFCFELSGVIPIGQQLNNGLPMPIAYYYFFGPNTSLFYEGFLFALIFVQIGLLKKMGIHETYIMDIENVHMAYVRKFINSTLYLDVH